MPRRPVVLIHGYSDKGESFDTWKHALEARGYDATTISVCSYETLTNEITIKDIAEGFDRALAEEAQLKGNQEFDAIVHSTGMLVVRSWLTSYADPRIKRLKHLVGLAPATWGSPLAHKGRSWIGAIFKGRKELGPDFMEAGNRVLDGLELASRFTWDLAHRDLLGEKTFYGPTKSTPFVFIFCGNRGYRGLRGLINSDGTDGTVRWAGCALNTRKFILDLTGVTGHSAPEPPGVDAPLVFVDDTDHGSIIREPPKGLIDQVASALEVDSEPSLTAWRTQALKWSTPPDKKVEWQQFVVHVIDERGDPVSDYNLQLLTGSGDKLKTFDLDVHVYRNDNSFRCFHVNLSKLEPDELSKLQLRLIASSGTALIGFSGIGSEKIKLDGPAMTYDSDGKWDAWIELPAAINDISVFYPYTTTLLEIKVNREPMPLVGVNNVLWFLPKRVNPT